MTLRVESLLFVGCICLTLALMEAWCLSGIRYLQLRSLKKIFPDPQYLLKSHIDFLLMTGLLFGCYLVFMQLRLVPKTVVLGAMCFGSMMNPIGFLVLAIKPTLPQTPTSVFGVIMTCSFLITTFGYLSAAWLIASAVWVLGIT